MAEDTDDDQKTEEPTSKRLEEARERGQLPISRDAAIFVSLLAALIVISYLSQPMAVKTVTSLRIFFEHPHEISLEGHGIQTAMFEVAANIGLATVLIFSLLVAASVLGTMIQTGFFVEPSMIKLKFESLSPMEGIKRIFSMNALAELVKNFFKLVVVGGVAFLMFVPLVNRVSNFAGYDLVHTIGLIHSEAVHLIIVLLLVVFVIAVADLLYQRFEYFKQLRMTKSEVKDEYKQLEGDPLIKSRLRQIRIEKTRKRMMANVPKADVVITNPTHYAIALQYDSAKMRAPVVVAKGVDFIAKKIRALAEEHKVPMISNPPLARALYDTVNVDEPIKTEHYRAVAEIISYVYKLKKKRI